MPSAAQIQAKANFKKAIAYRKKNNCSLKEAFKAVYPKKKAAPKKAAKKKVSGYVKTLRKGTKTDVIYSKAAKKTKAAKHVQQKLFGVKRKAAKKPVSSHKDTKSHNVNIRVVSGIGKNLIDQRNHLEKMLNNANIGLSHCIDTYKTPGVREDLKANAKKLIVNIKHQQKTLKLHLKEINQLIAKSY